MKRLLVSVQNRLGSCLELFVIINPLKSLEPIAIDCNMRVQFFFSFAAILKSETEISDFAKYCARWETKLKRTIYTRILAIYTHVRIVCQWCNFLLTENLENEYEFCIWLVFVVECVCMCFVCSFDLYIYRYLV